MSFPKDHSQKPYKLLEHTADIGIRVKSKNLKGVFKDAASAMFDILAEKQKRKILAQKTLSLKQQAANKEELLLAWLNELLSLSAVKGLVFHSFTIKRIDENNLEAMVKGEDSRGYEIKTEIKAATFNGLMLKKSGSGYTAEVVFDV
ncbi:MAG: archease [Candidatus Omnitrophica bacterium]|nr:archease [Candidatus Omnitrophota bacterium]